MIHINSLFSLYYSVACFFVWNHVNIWKEQPRTKVCLGIWIQCSAKFNEPGHYQFSKTSFCEFEANAL